ncbi:hypothetical protein AUK40_06400 [Candidatus Wirthbacteria bacterium CG2_30_54_11]|uniref:Uncharacterized protein n=1 Tax=Candidatus Wirthbacteria bacterium CG2_30_54_11 TaxID=1817892 RepID=A0A1J5IRX2_9BACT|nr:MAG: hypothetical protein AUK40_06400 [Candidatus Wirthbacteria bacterium CG2_30_54_11]
MITPSGRFSRFAHFFTDLNLTEKIKLLFSVLGLTSPFFPWFHSCNNIPGSYQCVTWNGFQWDNDIYGLLVFLLSVTVLILVLYPLFETTWKLSLGRERLSTMAGAALILLAIMRLLTFQGTSSQTTRIGPSMGLLFVFVTGLGIVICDNTQIVQKMLSFILTPSNRASAPAGADDQEDLSQYDDQELIDLLDDEAPAEPAAAADGQDPATTGTDMQQTRF